MRRVLLDAHVFLWGSEGPSSISPAALDAIESAEEAMLSVATCREIAIKHGLGRLSLKVPLARLFETQFASGVSLLPISLPHVLRVADLPRREHRDPFDRLLAAQALVERVAVVSVDTSFDQYGVERIW